MPSMFTAETGCLLDYEGNWVVWGQTTHNGRVQRYLMLEDFPTCIRATEALADFKTDCRAYRMDIDVAIMEEWAHVPLNSEYGRWLDTRLAGYVDGQPLGLYYQEERERAREDGLVLVRMHRRRHPDTY